MVLGVGWLPPPLVTADGEVRNAPTSSPRAEGPAASLPGVPPPAATPPPVQSLSVSREFASVVVPGSALAWPTSADDDGPRPSNGSIAAPRVDDVPAAAPLHVEAPARSLDAVTVDAAPAVARSVAPPSKREQPILGVQLDVGFPDGVGASFMVMPADWLRLQVGGSWNGASRGLRAGIVALLFPSFFKSVRPTVSLEGGYAFDTDSQWLDSLVQDDGLKAALTKVNVLHGGGHLGLEFGSKYFSFFLRAGVSYVDVQLASYEGESVVARGLALHGLFPSGKLGFLVCFL